jgi:signal transduction histidine kinase
VTAARPGRTPLRSLGPFLALSVLGLVLVGALTVLWGDHIARSDALAEALATTRGVIDGVVSPRVTPALLAGDPAAVRSLDAAVANRVQDGSLRRLRLVDAEDRIVYSDQHAEIGRHSPGVWPAALRGADSTVSTATRIRSDGLAGRDGTALVQVHTRLRGPAGRPLLLEADIPAQGVEENAARIRRDLLPVTLGSLLLLLLLLLPLAFSLVRRVERAEHERQRMLQNSITASDVERRRIAHDLHDGVIQDLAGLAYALTSMSNTLPADSSFQAIRTSTGGAAAIVRRDVAALRGLLTAIYPPDLRDGELLPALRRLVEDMSSPELSIRLDHDPPETLGVLSEEHAVLLYRVVRESLRNVVKHAHAATADVALRRDGAALQVQVRDDGVGIAERAVEPGHFGMRLVDDAVRDWGGSFAVRSAPGAGTLVEVRLPLP